MEELLTSAMNQNFIPVVDDAGIFIGLVTRKEIIRYLAEKADLFSDQTAAAAL
jgi:CBS domain-containing protein